MKTLIYATPTVEGLNIVKENNGPHILSACNKMTQERGSPDI